VNAGNPGTLANGRASTLKKLIRTERAAVGPVRRNSPGHFRVPPLLFKTRLWTKSNDSVN